MPDYLVETYESADGRHPSPAGLAGVEHRRSIFVPDDEVVLHVVAGPSLAAVREALDRGRFSYDRIVEAVDTSHEHRQGETSC